jgi:hypothetical protein
LSPPIKEGGEISIVEQRPKVIPHHHIGVAFGKGGLGHFSGFGGNFKVMGLIQ